MNEMPSAQFRKVYAKLREAMVVTVNGHGIGMWTPLLSDQEIIERLRVAAIAPREEILAKLEQPLAIKRVEVTAQGEHVFAQYRPVPKPGRK
jgi:hypothetical protein